MVHALYSVTITLGTITRGLTSFGNLNVNHWVSRNTKYTLTGDVRQCCCHIVKFNFVEKGGSRRRVPVSITR
jgi:hypothetical protein